MTTLTIGRSERAATRSLAATAGPLLLALTPAGLTIFLAFHDGGFFVGATAVAVTFLLLLIGGRVMLAPLPAEGINRTVVIAVGALALFAVWTLLSSRWSAAPSRALSEFDRVLLYASALLAFGLTGMTRGHLSWMVRGLALATVVVCGAGLMTRLLPDVWPIVEHPISTRLSYPVSYWNAFALLAAIGITLCFGLTSSDREPRVVRVLSAAAIPVLGAALLATLSRAGLATAGLGVLTFAVVGHPRALLCGVLATVPATAVALSATYGADLLFAGKPPSIELQAEGHHVAAIVVACALTAAMLRALLLPVDEKLAKWRPDAELRRRVLRAGLIGLVLATAAVAVAVDAPSRVEEFAASGTSADPGAQIANNRDRLTNITDNGRIAAWTVAVDELGREPLHGTGAGTWELSWDRHRPTKSNMLNAHSLYAEVGGELGIPGLLLLALALGAILVGVARRLRGDDRVLFATIFAVITTWAIAAAIDWHWQMPVVTLLVFALGGAAIAAERRASPPGRFLAVLPRSVIALAIIALVVLVPVRLGISEQQLHSTVGAFERGQCTEVSVYANEALDTLSSRPQPLEYRAACELRTGHRKDAIATLNEAVERDPDNWRQHYSLGVALAYDGQDPRGEFRRARRRNPRGELILDTLKALRGKGTPGQWRRVARDTDLEIQVPPV